MSTEPQPRPEGPSLRPNKGLQVRVMFVDQEGIRGEDPPNGVRLVIGRWLLLCIKPSGCYMATDLWRWPPHLGWATLAL